MKSTLITILRDKTTSIEKFRSATEQLGLLLAHVVHAGLENKNVTVQTPLGKAKGHRFAQSVVLIPILRAGLTLLPPFVTAFPEAKVGMIGLRRNEKDATAHMYYENIPQIGEKDQVILLDPMIATGGSTLKTIDFLVKRGVKPEKITTVHIISAPQGLEAVKTKYPRVNIIVAQEDERLTDDNFIYPGLGDYGDRYYGTGP